MSTGPDFDRLCGPIPPGSPFKTPAQMAADILESLAAQATRQALFHTTEALRLAAVRPLRARMRHRPGLYSRPKMKRAERVARNFAAAAAYSAAAVPAAVGARALRLPR